VNRRARDKWGVGVYVNAQRWKRCGTNRRASEIEDSVFRCLQSGFSLRLIQQLGILLFAAPLAAQTPRVTVLLSAISYNPQFAL
jgi:hypothetical protein